MAHRFHVNMPLGLGRFDLDGEEARHLAVSRIRIGEKIVLFNGDGFNYPAVLVQLGRRDAILEIEARIYNTSERKTAATLASPLPKGDREQILIEKLVELGVNRFYPLATERSVIHPEPKRLERLTRHVIEASKQCGRSQLMSVEPVSTWEHYLALRPPEEVGCVAHGPAFAGQKLPVLQESPARIWGAVGPEGGLTETEAAMAVERGWKLVDLGPRILRMETAAIVLAWELGQISDCFQR
jgi:16S rRNA (uracil1498-N3)-methyltransferase